MKNTVTIFCLLLSIAVSSQAFTGKGDSKFNVGANLQSKGTGLQIATDYGLGDNMSYGFVASYLLGVNEDVLGNKPAFADRFDAKLRFNANIGTVFNLDEKMDIYPGLDLGLRNFGAHLGFRYFFTDGFGIYTEAGLPLAKYKTNALGFDKLNNQFTVNIGASFNL